MLELGRLGRSSGGGFYDYGRDSEQGSKQLWPELKDIFMDGSHRLSQQEMIDRILFIQALETVRCLEQGVINSVADANIGSIYGWGFAPAHGGTLQFINAYGVSKFVERAKELRDTYGDRFAPPKMLEEMVAEGRTFQ